MALIECPDCSKEISSEARICIHCGRPTRKVKASASGSNRLLLIIVLVVLLGVFSVMAVPVMGMVAAISIPTFLAMQLRAKRAEAPTHLDAIRTAEFAYQAEFGHYTAAPYCPSSTPWRMPEDWTGDCTDGWTALGWSPDGLVRCRYMVTLTGDPGTEGFEAVGECDVDGDGTFSVYSATDARKTWLETPNNVY